MIKTMNNNFYLYENNIRESGNNELVFGEPGQGQTICLKQELLQFAAKHMSNTEDKFQVFVTRISQVSCFIGTRISVPKRYIISQLFKIFIIDHYLSLTFLLSCILMACAN